jgi:hypothetical protein
MRAVRYSFPELSTAPGSVLLAAEFARDESAACSAAMPDATVPLAAGFARDESAACSAARADAPDESVATTAGLTRR